MIVQASKILSSILVSNSLTEILMLAWNLQAKFCSTPLILCIAAFLHANTTPSAAPRSVSYHLTSPSRNFLVNHHPRIITWRMKILLGISSLFDTWVIASKHQCMKFYLAISQPWLKVGAPKNANGGRDSFILCWSCIKSLIWPNLFAYECHPFSRRPHDFLRYETFSALHRLVFFFHFCELLMKSPSLWLTFCWHSD